MMERDPQDNKVTFAEITDVPEIHSLEDVGIVLAGLHKTALTLYKLNGYVMYPVFKVAEDAPDNS